ncbi:hypothetical protein GS445_06785 [Rhodococcus hoagii]|nr:hypothetical protein [Prescottella equi]MBM4719838.1 hypothetical protein [Prescottella equi]
METTTESMFMRLHAGNGEELDLDFELGPVHSLDLGTESPYTDHWGSCTGSRW